ncbi:MAG TPA: hypothetical protein DCP31_33075 [Cyanobacteria bacterium UBA8543]|nr:hypothetical protein [Cyanobacteria bacterium UBA8543]
MRKLFIAVGALSLLVGCNAQQSSMSTSSHQAFKSLFAQSQKPPVADSGKVVAVATQNRQIHNSSDSDTFFYNVCKQSAKQASQPTEPNPVVTRFQLESLARACQSRAKSINQAWLSGL